VAEPTLSPAGVTLHTAHSLLRDKTPQLGGDLDANAFDLTGVGHVGFLATQDPSAGANDLDDYEEGSWTPEIADDSLDGSGEGQAYANQLGRYTKIGNLVTFFGRVKITDLGTLTTTQSCRIVGLPFTSENTANLFGNLQAGFGGSLAIAAGTSVSGYVAPNVAYSALQMWDFAGGATSAPISEISVGGELIFSGQYRV